jgi:hypothetical protein
MPWMNVLRKPRLNRTVVNVAVDTAANLVRLLSVSDMAIEDGRYSAACVCDLGLLFAQ